MVIPYLDNIGMCCWIDIGFLKILVWNMVEKTFTVVEQGINFLEIDMHITNYKTLETDCLLYGSSYMHNRSLFKQMNLTCTHVVLEQVDWVSSAWNKLLMGMVWNKVATCFMEDGSRYLWHRFCDQAANSHPMFWSVPLFLQNLFFTW